MSRRQPGDDLEVARRLRVGTEPLVGRGHERHVDVRRLAAARRIDVVRPEHADDLVGDVVERQGAPEHGRIAAVGPLPEAVADDGDTVAALDFLPGVEEPAGLRLETEHLEYPGGGLDLEELLGGGAGFVTRCQDVAIRGHGSEGPLRRRPVSEVLRRHARKRVGALGRVDFADADQPAGGGERQLPERDRVDHRVERRGRADAERQHQHGRGSEGRRLGERT